jgi:tRNA(Ile2) C34 agmatinyltransferase TiaS
MGCKKSVIIVRGKSGGEAARSSCLQFVGEALTQAVEVTAEAACRRHSIRMSTYESGTGIIPAARAKRACVRYLLAGEDPTLVRDLLGWLP